MTTRGDERTTLLVLPSLLMFLLVAISHRAVVRAEVRFPSCKTHAFFYLWYDSPEASNGTTFTHWNHRVLPHWTQRVNEKWSAIVGEPFHPPAEVHSLFYPAKGPYSSSDPGTIRRQFQEMKRAGVCAAILSWWGRPDREGTSDTQGVNTDDVVGKIVRAAEKFEDGQTIRIGFHMEPYPGRTAASTKEDVEYLHNRYAHSRAMLRDDRDRLVFYIYDSYHVPSSSWRTQFDLLRHTTYDGCFIGLILGRDGVRLLNDAGFDGGYSYFASKGFSFGSTTSNWLQIARSMRTHDLSFIPSVGPGYDDSAIRPWNAREIKSRGAGSYYDDFWREALATNPPAVSITSWNEWGEGTQIEPAIPKTILAEDVHMKSHSLIVDKDSGKRVYRDYRDGCENRDPCEEFYLKRTSHWVSRYHGHSDEPYVTRHVETDGEL